MFIKRFKQLLSIIMKLLFKNFYILRNVFIKREFRDFAQRILYIIINVNINNIDS